ncbi:cobalt transporter CbiM [Methanobacterium formicicum]|uniref:Cobalt transport protein CbiM n=1 Tax=Methanobacterium formicicum (strain DSM 3637 / PP1) TaxID=1204725 RepID=K2RBC5_METFP|nr:cobalt transporter CbiM [Methanobacterium formicicum]EKF85619.1 cobalt transport protein CbiM [Methanobacterium formicicum DSM 3637]
MHIPDGFIPLWQCAIYYVILIVALYFAQKWARENLDEKAVPLLAVLAAGIFAIMSMNMPIPFGTSGHMVGGALVAIVFCAPEAAIIVFTLVLLVQGLFFGDGGITALGANVLNMGIIGGFVGLYTFKGLRKPIGKYPAIFIASWLSIFLAAEAVAVEMWLAGTFPLVAGLASMGIYHAFIGIIEGVLTVVVIMALEKLRPDLLAWNRNKKIGEPKSETGEVAAK